MSTANRWQENNSFLAWVQHILLPYRIKKGFSAEDWILLVMDGHKTHMCQPIIDICRENKIQICYLEPHTSHVSQPLDISIFSSYKANFKRLRSSSFIKDLEIDGISVSMQKRVFALARSLVAIHNCTSSHLIRRSFFKTGLYPLSFETFIYYAKGVRGVPDNVKKQAQEAMNKTKCDRDSRIVKKQRIDISSNLLIVQPQL